MRAGVSSACLYPMILEESIEFLGQLGIGTIEIFINTDVETNLDYIKSLAEIMKKYDMKCVSVHPYSCPIEPMMFFSDYERRVTDGIEYYKKYFHAMNILGAEIFVFHGNKDGLGTTEERYFERFERLSDAGREYGITIAQENVARCQSHSLKFMKNMCDALGDKAKFVLDVKQAVRSDEDPFKIAETLGNHIIHVHMSDHGSKGDCLPIGEGDFNIEFFLKSLKAKGFDGAVMLELYRKNFGADSELRENCRKLEHITDLLNREHV